MANLERWNQSDQRGLNNAMARFRRDMDQLFERFFDFPSGFAGAERGIDPFNAGAWSPAIDIKDKGEEVVVCAELPGLKPEDFDISVSGDVLQIRGERKEDVETQERGYYTRERRYGAFARSIQLPPGTDPEKIKADYQNGELTVHIGKSQGQQRRQIPVNGGASKLGNSSTGTPGRAAGTAASKESNSSSSSVMDKSRSGQGG